jgi:RNA polymerase sigma-70 factor, ECF subfamily
LTDRTTNDAQGVNEGATGTLGSVLYGHGSKNLVLESDWVLLIQSIADGNQLALHQLYARTHRVVFTLVTRIIGNRDTAEDVTVDVFQAVWREAHLYDAASGPVIAWIMNLARARAVQRLNSEQRESFRNALQTLTPAERQAIETAYFGESTYPQAAKKLNKSTNDVKREIHSALEKLGRSLKAGYE